MATLTKSYAARPHRLHALCPYFAMFPSSFARENVLAHTDPGDTVLDPFSGRGTTLLESLLVGRKALAIDINPVAACVTSAKGNVPALSDVQSRLSSLVAEWSVRRTDDLEDEADNLPEFFTHAFHRVTLLELLFLRRQLKWRTNVIDCYIAALALGSLHGEMDRSPSYFSNQMPRTISPKPGYAVRFWKQKELTARQKHVFEILQQRAVFRLRDGRPSGTATIAMADSRAATQILRGHTGEVSAVITSPPYLDVTSFEEDQWLRLWFLGGEPHPTYAKVSKDDRHTSARRYWQFLAEVWQGVAPLLKDSATIVCRIGGNSLTVAEIAANLQATIRASLPAWSIYGEPVVTPIGRRQTQSFRPGSVGCKFEVDVVLRPSTN